MNIFSFSSLLPFKISFSFDNVLSTDWDKLEPELMREQPRRGRTAYGRNAMVAVGLKIGVRCDTAPLDLASGAGPFEFGLLPIRLTSYFEVDGLS